MNKLIKLSSTHYIIVDDSETVNGMQGYNPNTKNIEFFCSHPKYNESGLEITHSTELIDKNIKQLSLSEVEEAIYGYNVDELAEKYLLSSVERNQYGDELSFIEGFKTHQELVKDKFILSKNDILKIITMSREAITPHGIINMESWISSGYEGAESAYSQHQIIESLLPKTEWKCTFNEEGKLIIQK